MIHQHPLRREREQRGWSQAKVAELLETSPVSVSQWERGKFTPSPYFRERLCALFEKDAHALGFLSEPDREQLHVLDPFLPLQSLPTFGLIGREPLITALVEQLCTDSFAPAIAIHGLPGVGKTALLLALAQRQEIQAHFSDGILWAGLGTHPLLFEHLHRWGKILRVPQEETKSLHDLSSWAKCLRTYIGTRKLLLLLDDVWSVEDALALQVGGVHCVHLVTTRSPSLATQLGFHKTFHVPELEVAQGQTLLTHFLPHFAHREPEILQQLVQEVGTLPLALTLIGKYLYRYEAPERFRQMQTALRQLHDLSTRLHLQQPQSLIDHHPSLPPEYSHSLEAIIAVSDQSLSVSAHSALHTLAVFPTKPQSFSEEAALAVTSATLKEIDELYDSGLLESHSLGRYMLHQTIADYVQEHELPAPVIHRFIDYTTAFITKHERKHDQLEQEIAVLFQGLELASVQGREADFVLGICSLTPFLNSRGLYNAATQQLEKALQTAYVKKDVQAHMHVLLLLSDIALDQGDYEKAMVFLDIGMHDAHCEKHASMHCKLLCELSNLLRKQGNYTQAERSLQQALTITEECDLWEEKSQVLFHLSVICEKQGQYDIAELYLSQAQQLASDTSNWDILCRILGNKGTLAERRGNYEQAETYFVQVLELARLNKHQELICKALGAIASIQIQGARCQEAKLHLQEMFERASAIGHQELICHALEGLAEVQVEEKRDIEALTTFQQALLIAEILHHPLYVSVILRSIGEIHLRAYNLEQAQTYFAQALENLPLGNRLEHASILFDMAQVASAQENMQDAQRHAQASTVILETIGHKRAKEVCAWLAQLPLQEDSEKLEYRIQT